jgi:hypothetical protein
MRTTAAKACGLFLSLSFLGALGCSKIIEKIQQKAIETAVEKGVESQSGGKVKLDLNGQKASVVANDGKTQATWGKGATVPSDFPKQVPIYPGSTILSSMSDNSTTPKHTVMLKTPDGSAKVIEYYKGELKAFHVENEGDTGKTHMVKFVDKVASKLAVQVVASEEEGDTTTNVIVYTEVVQ